MVRSQGLCITFGNVLVFNSDSIVPTVPVKLEVHPLFVTAYSFYFKLPSISGGCLLISKCPENAPHAADDIVTYLLSHDLIEGSAAAQNVQ
jgi:hypothetical protein